jgi:hypothetical protein
MILHPEKQDKKKKRARLVIDQPEELAATATATATTIIYCRRSNRSIRLFGGLCQTGFLNECAHCISQFIVPYLFWAGIGTLQSSRLPEDHRACTLTSSV